MDRVALADGDLSRLPAREQALLRYVRVLTRDPSKVNDGMTQSLRNLGWSDDELFEASFVTALFAFFNRMAEAYGLGFEGAWRPPVGSAWDKPAPARAETRTRSEPAVKAVPDSKHGRPGAKVPTKTRPAAARPPKR